MTATARPGSQSNWSSPPSARRFSSPGRRSPPTTRAMSKPNRQGRVVTYPPDSAAAVVSSPGSGIAGSMGALLLFHLRNLDLLAPHPPQDQVLPPAHPSRPVVGDSSAAERAVRPRARPPAPGRCCARSAESKLARRLHPPHVGSQFHHVQVQLQDSLLAQGGFEAPGDDGFLQLAKRVAGRGEVEILGQLLGDCAGAAQLVALAPGAGQHRQQLAALLAITPAEGRALITQGVRQREVIDPAMREEVVVLADDHGVPHGGGDRVEREPAGTTGLAPGPLRAAAGHADAS